MGEPTTADFVRALRIFANIADRSAMHPEYQRDASTHAIRALAALAGADALEQLQASRDRLADLEAECTSLRVRLGELGVSTAELHIALSAARKWMVDSGLPLTDGQAILREGHASWVNVDAALAADPPARGRAILDQVERLKSEVANWEAVARAHQDEAIRAFQLDKRLEEFEHAIVEALGELRWDKISAALVALHAPALDLGAAPEEAGGG